MSEMLRRSKRNKKNEIPKPPTSLPSHRMNSILSDTRIRCADIKPHIRDRLKLKSCSKCDLFESCVNLGKQGDVCQRWYGCRREIDPSYKDTPIKVRFFWSNGRNLSKSDSNETAKKSTADGVNESNMGNKRKIKNISSSKSNVKELEKQIMNGKEQLKKQENAASVTIDLLRRKIERNSMNLRFVSDTNKVLEENIKNKDQIIDDQNKVLEEKISMLECVESDNKILIDENIILLAENDKIRNKLRYELEKIKSSRRVRDDVEPELKLVSAVNNVLKGVRYEKRTEYVLDLIFDGTLFGDVGGEVGEEYARDVMRKSFSAWKLCRAKDTAPQGCLNLQGLGHVRCVEELEKGEQGLFASKSAIWREGNKLLKKLAIPLLVDKENYHKVLELGDTVQLHYERLRMNTTVKLYIVKREEVESNVREHTK